MSEPLNIKSTIKFEVKVRVEEDVTCYGNRFWLQIVDDITVDFYPLRSFLMLPYKATIILEVPEDKNVR